MKTITAVLILLFTTGFVLTRSLNNVGNNNQKSDTLKAGYTYWWPDGGPFTGLCGNPYMLVFTGTLTKIWEPTGPYPTGRNVGDVMYYPQKGVISIEHILYRHNPTIVRKDQEVHNYSGEHYFMSDCFYDMKLMEGDKVIAFVYDYEGAYSIPSNSVLRLKTFTDPVVLSIEKYIKNDQDPLSIAADTNIWSYYGCKDALKQIIQCRIETKEIK
jgi:hypothetical protein